MATGRRQGESDEQRRERMHELARRSAEIRRKRKAEGDERPNDPPQTRMATKDEERDAHLATLQAVIDEPKSLASDRIRAVEARERILSRQEEEQREEAWSELRALRDALDAIPPEARGDALVELLSVR